MRSKVKKFIKQLFCKHLWKFIQSENTKKFIAESMKKLGTGEISGFSYTEFCQCTKCDKIIGEIVTI